MKSIQRGEEYAETKYWGTYRAIVIDNKDPKKLGRIVLQVPEIFGLDLVTDWARPKGGYLSAKNSSANNPKKPPDQAVLTPDRDGDKGDFFVPDIGDGVWVEFEAGDACRPLWSGRWWAEPGGGSEVPMLAREKPDESQVSPKGTDVLTDARSQDHPEPPISYDPTYPLNRVLKTKRGIIVEIDDTPGKERIHIWHPKRTWKEVHPDGTVTEHIQVSRYVYLENDDDLHVKGDWNVEVEGDATLNVHGDYVRHVGGNMVTQVDGIMQTTVSGRIIRVSNTRIDDVAVPIHHNSAGGSPVLPIPTG